VCEFLKREAITPHELAARFKAGYYRDNPQTPYLCSVCDLCKRVCPEELSVGDMCMEIREEMVASGLGPLPGHKVVRKDQEWSTSDAVVLAQPDPNTGRCERLFFPGCGLSGNSPELVSQVLTYLQEKLPNTGILLGCCGGPTYFLGDRPLFEKILSDFLGRIERLGASELILACPDCYHNLKRHAPGLQLRALPEVIQEQGMPAGIPSQAGSIFSIHDSCKARFEKGWQDSVRSLLSHAGHSVEEMAYSRDKTRCCGHGGMVSYADFELEGVLTENRANEATHNILTYCAACRDALAMHKPAVHILEVLFNPEWEQVLEVPPKSGKKRRENQARLKTMLEKR
jgi:Fe-S oxidoreductase